ncbi:hypothetical protein [Paludibacterium denitrificans]|nr:hypothetical protein [Paludibacterium denitrificans]
MKRLAAALLGLALSTSVLAHGYTRVSWIFTIRGAAPCRKPAPPARLT